MKIAYFSPLPPQRTGIADYSVELLPALLRRAEVDLWIDQAVAVEALPSCKTFNYVDKPGLLQELGGYDAIVYHMGNSPAHRSIFPVLLAYPGIVVLHDFVLHHFLAGYYMESLREPESYVEEMGYNYGSAGEEVARGVLKTRTWIWEHEPLRYPLNKRVLDHARGLIVHSELAVGLVRKSHPHLPITKINIPALIDNATPDMAELRQRYKIPRDRVVLGSLGSANHAKRTDAESVRVWTKLLSEAGLNPVTVDGVLFYNVPAGVLVSYRTATAHMMAEREVSISFGAMISAANRYLAAGFPLAKVDPWEARRRNVIDLPGDTRSSADDPRWWRNLWLGPWGDSLIGVGVVGDYRDVRFLIEKYRADSTDIFFPYPARLADRSKNGTGQLVVVFTPQGLQRAATRAIR
ncbi:MAG TPA: hypothetical protein VGY99_14235 [Candidatus Binataceae bacterium]|nr:hypothetical protein [Candidatus Binataceae bacterium]